MGEHVATLINKKKSIQRRTNGVVTVIFKHLWGSSLRFHEPLDRVKVGVPAMQSKAIQTTQLRIRFN